jgi:predicted acylesterase/phospholipase RssA
MSGRLHITVALACTALVSCNNAIHYAPDVSAFDVCRPAPRHDTGEMIVGLALSGGGSRSAVFAASALEALWEHGLLADVSHVSGVSGGSIAAAYFVSRQPDCDQGADGSLDACWRGFFDEFQRAMRYNFWAAMKRRQLWRGRFLSSSRFATSLMEVLDREFLEERTFADLRRQGPGGIERPILLLNASSYDEARRFVFSNLCLPLQVNEPAASELWPTHRYEPLTSVGLRSATFSQPGCDRPVPGELRLSLAVASSAAFPGLIGPITLEVPTGCGDGETEYLHLTDGGVFDNSGLDTLEEVVLHERASSAGRLRRVLLVSLDARLVESRDELTRIRDYWTTYHPGGILAISQRRGHAYHDRVWDRVEGQMREEGIVFERIILRYIAAELDRWPETCKEAGEPGTENTRRRIRERLASIGTQLHVGACDADLLQMAGHAVVHATLDREVVGRLRGEGFAIQEASDGF